MSYTNETKKLHLPQWVGTDRPTYLVDFNTAFLNIDNAFVAQDIEIASILSKLNMYISKMLGTGDDLNNLDNGHYSLPPNEDYVKQNRPTKKAGFLYVYNDNVGTWQIYVDSDSQMYIRSKMHDGNWSSWNRLVGESEYKNFVNNVNNDITQIRNTANNAESVANSAKNVADSAKKSADDANTAINDLKENKFFLVKYTGFGAEQTIQGNGRLRVNLGWSSKVPPESSNFSCVALRDTFAPTGLIITNSIFGEQVACTVNNITNNPITFNPSQCGFWGFCTTVNIPYYD